MMPAPAKTPRTPVRVDELLQQAAGALARRRCFEAEHLCEKALQTARAEQDFEGMARVVAPLWKARQQRLERAAEATKVRVVDSPVSDDVKVAPGLHLVQPPLVGADARRLRLAAQQQEVAAAVLCREPVTSLKQTPIVALAPGITIRTKVPPPANAAKPDVAWFLSSLAALGDAALQSLDDTLTGSRRVDALLERLDAIPDHEQLHQALEDACQQAASQRAKAAADRAARPARPRPEPADDDVDE